MREKSGAGDFDALRLGSLDFTDNVLIRNHQYTVLLKQYAQNQRRLNTAQLWFKGVVFFVVCAIFLAVVIFGALGIWNISQKGAITWQDLGAALAGLGSILSVIVVLPTKIAEHLFPAAGDRDSIEFVKSMQAFDHNCYGAGEDVDDDGLPGGTVLYKERPSAPAGDNPDVTAGA